MRGLKRFVKRAMFVLLVLVGVLALVFFSTRAYLQRQGNQELAEVTTKLDSDDPGWRMEPVLAKRNEQAIAADQDAVPIVLQVGEFCETDDWNKYRYFIEWGDLDY